MSPSETSSLNDYLEYPTEALDYYQRQKVSQVICQAKHMGSRAVMVVCKNSDVAEQRFGIAVKYGESHQGCVYTRTGRPFFKDSATEQQILELTAQALTESGIFESLNSDWVILDAEIMPWSAKAGDLLQKQYAAVGSAATEHLNQLTQVLQTASTRLPELNEVLQRQTQRQQMVQQYIQAYRQYCWPVNSLADLKIAPFHLLASKGQVHTDKNHLWHMQQLAQLAAVKPDLFVATEHRIVDLNDEASRRTAIDWWLTLTAAGGEGMVVKPLDFIVKGPKGWSQPAIKCRGREYLRIIYGPDYTLPEHLNRLKQRGLSSKRSLALREFSLGIEGLERFVRYSPLRQVHVCAMGVLALESEPVDPRL